jgi:glycerate dehydrogenase
MQTTLNGQPPVIVVLDGHTLNPGDPSWAPLRLLGETHVYDRSSPSEIIERAKDANIILVNKILISREIILQLPRLKCICVTATGFNNIDLQAATERGITVCNVLGYGTSSVAQHVFALLLECSNHVALHSDSVKKGDWSSQPDFCYWKKPIFELQGKTMGIYGFGRIGQKVAAIALAFGMRVLATHKHPERDARTGVTFVNLPDLFAASDVVSLNAPLTADNRDIVNLDLLRRMKTTSILINTGRGELIVEEDLAEALQSGRPAVAALDVLRVEPPRANHPLFSLPNCLITPHLAWAGREARMRLLEMTVENVHAFLQGAPQNMVN